MGKRRSSSGPFPRGALGGAWGSTTYPRRRAPTYSCVYGQLGRTFRYSDERKAFFTPGGIRDAVREKLREADERGEKVDYISFVSDGEPTPDANLGELIGLLGAQGLAPAEKFGRRRIAVITNASLLNREDVKEGLMRADLASVKVDAVSPEVWRRVDRPKGTLRLERILEGVRGFARHYGGTLITESMLVRGLNDGIEEIAGIARFLQEINPFIS